MLKLAKKNNPTAKFAIIDIRDIETLNDLYDGIVCGFCLPYLSPTDTIKLIKDSYSLLTQGGILYLSFVDGNPTNSGFKISSSGDRMYFYYHELDTINTALIEGGFSDIEISNIPYIKSDNTTEIHTIILGMKR